MIFKQYQLEWQLRVGEQPRQEATAEGPVVDSAVLSALQPEAAPSAKGTELVAATSQVQAERVEHTQDSPLWSAWQQLPYALRQKRADVYLEKRARVDYLDSLCDFLAARDLSVLPYDDRKRYLPTDVLLLNAGQAVDAGTVCYLQTGKRAVWSFLKQCFPGRL